MKLLTTLLFTLALTVTLAGSAAARQSTLWGTEYLFAGQSLVAEGCYYRVTFQGDGNLVIYDRSSHVVWASNTANRGAAYAAMQADGNLVLYRWDGSVVWTTTTNGHPGATLTMQSDGNLVVYSGLWALWASDTWGEALGTTGGCPASAVTSTEPNGDRPGGDFAGFDLGQPRPLWCAYYCSQDSRCNAYTYVPPGVQGPNARCWLKSSVPALGYASGMMSGVIYR